MLPYRVKKNLIFEEFSNDMRIEYFDLKKDKFVHNIDTLYYTCHVDVSVFDDKYIKFIEYLDLKKKRALENSDIVIYDDIDSKFLTTGLGFGMYQYSIELKDKYIFFISANKINKDTPEVIVQIRSQHLWLFGEHRAVQDSFEDLSYFLSFFDIGIWKTQENRIDFAYHTNYIQDPLNFFKEENLNKMQVSNFKRWHKEGFFVGDEKVECDYISLGRRKSNNIFVRIYNKNQEVVNQNYKQFFIKVWLLNKMINRFDYFVLEKCFEQGSYDYVDKARLEFYLRYGQSEKYKKNIKECLKKNDNIQIRKLADLLTPEVTVICNIEFQTKRKFYSTMDNSISLLKTVTCKYQPLQRIYKILDNKDLFHKYLTTYVLRFIDYDSATRKSRCKTSSWWKRLQSIKLNNVIDDENRELIRKYQRNFDIQVMKSRVLNSLSILSLYFDVENEDNVHSDIVEFMSYLNESDVEKSLQYKKKKSAMLQSQLANLPSLDVEKKFALLDLETAEILN